MPVLDVRCPLDALARLEVRDGGLRPIAAGSGSVAVEVGAGLFEVVADAAGRRSDDVVRVLDGDDRVEVELTLPSSASSPNQLVDDAAIRFIDRIAAKGADLLAGDGGLALVVDLVAHGRAGGRGQGTTEPVVTGLESRAPLPLRWNIDADDGRWALADVEPGLYAVDTGGTKPAGLVIPVWPGWRTLLFLPLLPNGPAPWLATVHNLPLGGSASDARRKAELTAQLHATMTERTPVSAKGLRRFAGMLRQATADRGERLPPLDLLLLAHLALSQTEPDAAALGQAWAAEAERYEAAVGVATTDAMALRMRADEVAARELPRTGPRPTASVPVLAPSADAVLRYEARHPGALTGEAAAVFGARLTSPLWFRWDPSERRRSASPDTAFDPDVWRDTAASLAERMPSAKALDEVAHDPRADPTVARLAAHLATTAHVRRQDPADVMLESHLRELVLGTGLPAVGVLDAARRLKAKPPPPMWRRRAVGGVAGMVALGGLAGWLAAQDGGGAGFAVADRLSVAEDTSASLTPLANDQNPERLSIREVGGAHHGVVVLDGGMVIYTPAPDYSGPDTFSYTASDGAETSSAEVAVEVRPVNDSPVAKDDRLQIAGGASGTVNVVGNDRDRDGDSLTVVGTMKPSRGTVEIAGGSLRYTPSPRSRGIDRFSYEVSDGRGGEATAFVTVEIEAVNSAPVAQDDSVETAQEQPVEIRPLANDSDADNDPLSAVEVADPESGMLQPSSGGTFTYKPEKGFTGTDRFTYRASDGIAPSPPATVTVMVLPRVTITDVEVKEDTGPMEFTVRLSGASNGTVTVRFRVLNGSARSPGDFAAASGTLSFPPGQTIRTLSVRVTADTIVEEDETFGVELSGTDNAVIVGGAGKATGTIVNDDSSVD